MRATFPYPWSGKGTSWLAALLSVLFLNYQSLAQQSNLAVNSQVKWINESSPSFTVTATASPTASGSGVTGITNVSNNTTTDYATATVTPHGTLYSLAGKASVTVKDASNIYDSGNFVGFVINKGSGNIALSAANNGTAAGSTSSPVIRRLANDLYQVGFFTTGSFNEVKIEFTSETGLLVSDETFQVYYAFQNKFGALTSCNVNESLNLPNHNLTVTSSEILSIPPLLNIPTVSNRTDVITPSTTDYASVEIVLLSLLDKWISVKNNSTTFPKGSFAGFEVEREGVLTLSILGSIKVQTYLNGDKKEEKSGSQLLLSGQLLSSSRNVIGFNTKDSEFDEVRLFFSGLEVGVGVTKIYGAVVKNYCESSTALACNTDTRLTAPAYPVSADFNQAGLLDIGTLDNSERMIDADESNYATLSLSTGALNTTYISVRKSLAKIPASAIKPYFIGFDISRQVLVDIGLLQGLTVSAYKDGQPVAGESVSGNNLLGINTSIVTGRARQTVGFLTDQEFDEIRLTITQAASVDFKALWIYGAVLKEFCLPTAEVDCNVNTPVTNPTHPVYIDGANTGVDALVCVGCSIKNTDRVIDNNAANYAEIILTAGVAISADLTVANALQEYPEKTFAGFEIATGTLLSAAILGSSATITLLKDGSPVQTGTGNALLIGATTSLITDGFSRQTIGIVAKAGVTYDAIKITFNQLVNANLGTIQVYNAVFGRSCPVTLSCNQSYYMNQSTFPVFINSSKTGISGVASVLNGVRDAWNVISSDREDYATIKTDVTVAGAGTLSVRDALTVYPVGTTVGFTVGKLSSLVELDVFSTIRIKTFYNGVEQEEVFGTSLINLELLGIPLIGSGAFLYNVGFVTTKEFNEVQLIVGAVASADPLFNETRVYGAFADTRTSLGGALVCNPIANPDFNVTLINVEVPGNVKTNDKLPTGSTYGPAVPASSYPGGVVLNMNNSGSYTFVSNQKGVYKYNVPAIVPGSSNIDVPLVITVRDPNDNATPPIANPDVATIKGHATTPVPVLIDVKKNDGPGNNTGTLGTPSVATQPGNGAALAVDGKIRYTPNPNFFGEDRFTYTITETPSGLSATTDVLVRVKAEAIANNTLANDDYYSAAKGTTSITGNVLDNDTDPEGHTQKTIADQPSPSGRIASSSDAGTFYVDASGAFTFTPNSDFTGPAQFIYQIYDNGTPVAGATATAYFLISPDNTNPLPVHLVSFEAVKEGSNAVLHWVSSEEKDLGHFEVEQSDNGRAWQKIGTVRALGAKDGRQSYHFTDAGYRSGISYYRLKNVDKDMSFDYSGIVNVKFDALGSTAEIFPNPATDKIVLNKLDIKQVSNVQLINQLGQVVHTEQGLSTNHIGVRSLGSGIYLVRIELKNGMVTTQRIVISK